MATLKNMDRLTGIPYADVELMEYAAKEHARYSSITFKIDYCDDQMVVFAAKQGVNSAQAYQDRGRIIQIVHETFGRFFADRKILIRPYPYLKTT